MEALRAPSLLRSNSIRMRKEHSESGDSARICALDKPEVRLHLSIRTTVHYVRKSGERRPLIGLSSNHKDLIERIDGEVAPAVAARAAEYDRQAVFPAQDFAELRDHGLLLATLPVADGGLGYGFDGADPLSFFLIIERLARVSPSTAHCFQVHNNALQILRRYGTDAQVARFIQPTLDSGQLLVGAGSEPGGGRSGSVARPVGDGFRLDGRKHFSTNATHSTWMTVHMRNAEDGRMETLVVHRDNPGLVIDDSGWCPTGMRACVSPMLTFTDCEVEPDCVLMESGGFFDELWLGKINFGFTANYLGALQGVYDFARDYLAERPSRDEPLYQIYLGEMKTRIDALRLLFYRAVAEAGRDLAGGLLASNQARWFAVETATQVCGRIGQLVGSSGYFNRFPLERLLRDLQVHLTHRRQHVGIGVVGQRELGLEFDLNRS